LQPFNTIARIGVSAVDFLRRNRTKTLELKNRILELFPRRIHPGSLWDTMNVLKKEANYTEAFRVRIRVWVVLMVVISAILVLRAITRNQ